MIDQLIRTIKGIIPDKTWDFIFEQFPEKKVHFTKPHYPGVRVTDTYLLVKVPKELRKDDSEV